ncbi:MAG: tetratricopeptide repeat protein [Salinivirgaceae bacterium]
MSKKKEQKNQSQESTFENVEHALTSTEYFIEKNQRVITTAAIVITVIVLGYFGYQKYIMQPMVQEAQEMIFPAQQYFERDSFNLAINGDGNNFGFLDIIDEYGRTPSGNLAQYYAGVSYLRLGDYKKAIDYLDSYSADDIMTNVAATGAIGDSYVQLGEHEKGAKKYVEAANINSNKFTSPLYLMKAAQVYYAEKKYDKALELYKKIESDYPESTEYRQIEKYISRAQAML